MKRKTKFSFKTRKIIFSKGPVLLTDCEVRMPSGKILSRQIIETRGAVVIIPKIAKDRYLLIRQFRFAACDWLWEFPAGGIERGEALRQTAVRELIEEAGFRPKKLKKIVEFFATPGISSELMTIYLAEGLTPEYAEGDEDEELIVQEFSASQIERMIRSGAIRDGKTILGFLHLKMFG